MKYCPFCGAVLPDEKISFCLECGENLSELNLNAEIEKSARKAKKGKKSKSEKKQKNREKSIGEEPAETASDNYDGYYDDVTPKDSVMLHQDLDKAMIKNLVILTVGVITAISLCIAALVLFN